MAARSSIFYVKYMFSHYDNINLFTELRTKEQVASWASSINGFPDSIAETIITEMDKHSAVELMTKLGLTLPQSGALLQAWHLLARL